MKNLYFFTFQSLELCYNITDSLVYRLNDLSYDILKKYSELESKDSIRRMYSSKYSAERVDKALEVLSDIEQFSQQENKGSKNNDEIHKVTFVLTDRCNLRCKYCFEGKEMSEDIEYSTIKKTLDFLLNKNKEKKLVVSFFGGEPLLRYDLIEETINYIVEKGEVNNCIFSLTTNGTIMNERISKLIEVYNINSVISIDGDRNAHDMNRVFANGRGSFDLIMDNIDRFKELKKSLVPRSILSKDITNLNSFHNMFMEKGFMSSSYGIASTTDESLKLCSEEFSKVNKELEASLLNYIEGVVKGIDMLKPLEVNYISNLYPQVRSSSACVIGNSIVVNMDGNIYPCHRFLGEETQLIGNVEKLGSLDLEGELKVYRDRLSYMDDCFECWCKDFCKGGCMHENYMYAGANNKVEKDLCDYRKKMTEIMIGAYAYVCTNYFDVVPFILGKQFDKFGLKRFLDLSNL